jgi:hypothetical protein
MSLHPYAEPITLTASIIVAIYALWSLVFRPIYEWDESRKGRR